MGDALAAITRVASITKVYSIAHILTIANQSLDWSLAHSEQQHEQPELSGDQHDQEPTAVGNGKKNVECEGDEGGEVGGVEGEECGGGGGWGLERGSLWIPDDVCVSARHVLQHK